ncbi:uncharacterized protein JCM10292_003929 [Rhodotorula paludigena]|uniref:uncharacterized protein n=1 Tax=Rhodotorula paludigena TaxID=86838 RepID=UPI003172D138
MPAFSGLQALLYGVACIYTGWRLCSAPLEFLAEIGPATRRIEQRTGLKSHGGDEASLALAGLLLGGLGYFYLWAVYTLDEKHKRNSTSQRIFLGMASWLICTQTSHGSSLIALFGIINVVTGLLMGLSVGFGDGNAVDLELKARIEARRRGQPGGGSSKST